MRIEGVSPGIVSRLGIAACLLWIGCELAEGADAGRWVVKPAVPGAQQLFPPGTVRLLDGAFKTMQDADHAYLLRLEPDRLLAQFRVEAGLQPKARPYGGWESRAQPGKTWSLAGHSLGHYLSAVSLMYRITDDYRLKDRVAYIVRELKECQDKRGDGSLVAFPYSRELEADIRSNKVETIDKYWAPFYTIHKGMAGLRDVWILCGDATARDVLVKMADWCGSLVKDLSDERRERFLAMEHGGMAEVLADVYAITGEPQYLEYARQYSHRALLDPLADGIDNLTGKHANTQVPKFTGFQRIHELAGDDRAGAAARFFWQTVVSNRTWINGGNSIHEHFSEPNAMSEQITHEGGPETCNTYNMLRLTAALHRERPAAAYLDYYENALFNHILASQAPLIGAGAFVYYTPLRPEFARSYSTDFNSFWCCTGTGMENHARYGELIFSHDERSLYVNLFVASELKWPERKLVLRQETQFPDDTSTTIVLVETPAEPFTLRIRHPHWLDSDTVAVRINGQAVGVESRPGGFAAISRAWNPGDRVQVELPMRVRVVREARTAGWLSLFYGPILLAGKLGNEGLEPQDFIGSYTPAKALLPLSRAPMFVARSDDELLAGVRSVAGRTAIFRAEGVVKPRDVTLAPFYRVHFQRYAVYWQRSDAAHWEERQREFAEAERLERELETRTTDRVRVGEQQSEIDHNLLFENSRTGSGAQGRHYREARDRGWFSYELKLPPAGQPVAVQLMFWGKDDGREFDLRVDDAVIASPKLRGGRDDFYRTEHPIPANAILGKKRVTVRIESKPGNASIAIYDARIVTSPSTESSKP